MVKRICLLLVSLFITFLCKAQPDTMFFNLLLTTDQKLILDAQPNSMYNNQHILGAFNVPTKATLVAICDTVDRRLPIFVYCWSGDRSKNVVDILHKMGFSFVFEMVGGMEAFHRSGIIKKYSSYLVTAQ